MTLQTVRIHARIDRNSIPRNIPFRNTPPVRNSPPLAPQKAVNNRPRYSIV